MSDASNGIRDSVLAGLSGVHSVANVFLREFNWIFRAQPEADFGIDAQVEIYEHGRATGKLIALQIKSGPSYFKRINIRTGMLTYYIDESHLRYWVDHSLPVFLILENPESGLILWQRVTAERAITTGADRHKILIPTGNVLGARSKRIFSESIAAEMRAARNGQKAAQDVATSRMFHVPIVRPNSKAFGLPVALLPAESLALRNESPQSACGIMTIPLTCWQLRQMGLPAGTHPDDVVFMASLGEAHVLCRRLSTMAAGSFVLPTAETWRSAMRANGADQSKLLPALQRGAMPINRLYRANPWRIGLPPLGALEWISDGSRAWLARTDGQLATKISAPKQQARAGLRLVWLGPAG
jgi:hypothetical protein